MPDREIPKTLLDAVDALDRQAQLLPNARALKAAELSPLTLHKIVRATQLYLEGELDQAAQVFEALAEELKDRTMAL
ncbi:MAG: hypothetical protein KC503_21310 [Myxococcales bacterium]|nr:hypothetical protein [Myxococcales bacterium]